MHIFLYIGWRIMTNGEGWYLLVLEHGVQEVT